MAITTIQEILSLGRSGLNASKSFLGLTSQNVANVGTPGYSRQRMNIYTSPVMGLGVITDNPEAVRNAFTFKSILNTSGDKGQFDGQLAALSLLEPAVNEVDQVGLQAALSKFLDALGQVSANPTGDPERIQLVQAAKGLGAQFKVTAQGVKDAADGAVNQVKQTTEQINQKLQDIAKLNVQIKGLVSTNQNANALIDQRDLKLTELSEMVQVQVVHEGDGTVNIFAAGGRPLVEGLEASQLQVAGPDPNGQFTVQVKKPNGLLVDPLAPFGGKLGGLLKAYDEQILPAVDRLDEMAFQFMNSFNAQHQAGFGKDGSTGQNFFEPVLNQQGAAFNMKLSAAIDTNPDAIAAASAAADLPGGNDNLLLLMKIQESPILADGNSITSAWQNLGQNIGSAINTAQVGSLTDASTIDQLYSLQQAESGVSLDEEMINMTLAQKSLEAASAVIKASDEMYDTILSIVR